MKSPSLPSLSHPPPSFEEGAGDGSWARGEEELLSGRTVTAGWMDCLGIVLLPGANAARLSHYEIFRAERSDHCKEYP